MSNDMFANISFKMKQMEQNVVESYKVNYICYMILHCHFPSSKTKKVSR